MGRTLKRVRDSCELGHIPKITSVNDYDDIASVYDEVMGNDFYRIVFCSLFSTIRKYLSRSAYVKCVDLACGTGSFINRISLELDSTCFGIDLSAKQIAIARRKCRQIGGKVNFEVGDVLKTELPEKCDLVTMNFDALNHLAHPEDWSALFTRVYSILNPGGIFFFDINSRYRLLYDWSYPEVVVKKSATYIQCPFELLNAGRIVRRQILMLIYSKNDKVKEHKAIIEQISMPKSRMFELLHMSGFAEAKEVLQYNSIHKKHIFLKNRIYVGCVK